MTDKFEVSVKEFYNSEISQVEYESILNNPKITKRSLANNIACIFKYLIPFGRTSLKHFYKLEKNHQILETRLERCEKGLQNIQKTLTKSLTLIENIISIQKPLTKVEVQSLVQEITQQPKIVEEQTIRLAADLEKKVLKLEELVQHLINEQS